MEDLASAVLLEEALVRHRDGVPDWFRMAHWTPESLRSHVFLTLTAHGMDAIASAQRQLKDLLATPPAPLANGDNVDNGKGAVIDPWEWRLAVLNAKSVAPQIVAAAWNWSGRPQRPSADEED